MKSKIKTARRKKSATKFPPAPAGLNLLLSMIDGDTLSGPFIYGRAKQIIAARHDFSEGLLDAIRAEETVEAVFGFTPQGCEPPTVASGVKAGVMVGMAVAWALMADLNGGPR